MQSLFLLAAITGVSFFQANPQGRQLSVNDTEKLRKVFKDIGGVSEADVDRTHLKDKSTNKLIDLLINEENYNIGMCALGNYSGFMVIKNGIVQDSGRIGVFEPKQSDVIHEIIRRGVDALPYLVKNIDNDKKTKIILTSGVFGEALGLTFQRGGISFSDYYNFRFEKNKEKATVLSEKIVSRSGIEKNGKNFTYTARIGDLCFVCIGQIVNKHYHVTRYEGSDSIMVMSPIHSPIIAEAIKLDWSGLTKNQHIDLLILDALSSKERVSRQAGVRILFYYPDFAKEIIAK